MSCPHGKLASLAAVTSIGVNMAFFLIALVGMYVGRKIGWAISKPLYQWTLLFPNPKVVQISVILIGVLWGGLIAFGVRELILWQHPGLILRIIMGYALGAYVAIPNYGLMNKDTLYGLGEEVDTLLSGHPLIVYILASIGFAFLM